MAKMYVVTRVANKTYLVKVDAETMGGAERQILDKAVCGISEYSIEAAQAFDAESMKTDTFIWMALEAEPITMQQFDEIVEKRNEEVLARRQAQETISRNEREIEELRRRINQLSAENTDAERVLRNTYCGKQIGC